MATINTSEGYVDPQQHPLRGEAKRLAAELTKLTKSAEAHDLDLSEEFEAVRELLQSERYQAAADVLTELRAKIDAATA